MQIGFVRTGKVGHVMNDCRFCKSLEFMKELNARRTELDKQLFKVKYTVALVERTLGPYGKCGRTTDYGFRGCGYPLKYCPMCGEKIVRRTVK